MMQGYVVGSRACLPVVISSPILSDVRIVFAIDTGFEGALTLPLATIIALGLPKQQEISAKLADGSLTKVGVYRGSIFWHGVTVNLAVLAMDSDPLLGTSLLDGNLLFIDWADQGEVRIEQRP